MRTSLKNRILAYLKNHGRMSVQELEAVCHNEGRKISNGERRLRELCNPHDSNYNSHIETETNDRGAIIAYTYKYNSYETYHQSRLLAN